MSRFTPHDPKEQIGRLLDAFADPASDVLRARLESASDHGPSLRRGLEVLHPPTLMIGLLMLGMLHAPAGSRAQELKVTGTVLYNPHMSECFQDAPCTDAVAYTDDADWVPPRAAVNVVVKGTDRVAKTDRQGHYEISVPSRRDTLMFLYIGHNRMAVPIDGRDLVDVKLTPTPLPVIDRVLGVIMPNVVSGRHPGIDEMAREADVNRETMRDLLWLVMGNRPFSKAYPGEYIPDYTFEEDLSASAPIGNR